MEVEEKESIREREKEERERRYFSFAFFLLGARKWEGMGLVCDIKGARIGLN